MKKITRELLWICLPLLIVGGGFGVWRTLHPPLDPNAKINLTIQQQKPLGNGENSVWLGWQAKAVNGPEHGFLPGFHQTIWAVGRNGKTLIAEAPAISTVPVPQVRAFGAGEGPLGWDSIQNSMKYQEIAVPREEIPPGTDALEWRGEFVVAPGSTGDLWRAMSPSALRQLAQRPSAAIKSHSFRVPISK